MQAADLNKASRLKLIRTMQAGIYNARPYILLSYDE